MPASRGESAGIARIRDDQVRAALMEQVISGIPSFWAVPDLHWITDVPRELRGRHPVNLEALGDGSFVQVCPTLDYKVLWARADDDQYRASYNRFLAVAYPDLRAVPAGHHVDHLFNRKRAQGLGLVYVRMALVPAGVNMSHGGGYESGRTRSGMGTPGRPRKIDDVIMMKLMGFRSPPRSGAVTDEMRAFAEYFGTVLGERPSQILHEIANLTGQAARGPRP